MRLHVDAFWAEFAEVDSKNLGRVFHDHYQSCGLLMDSFEAVSANAVKKASWTDCFRTLPDDPAEADFTLEIGLSRGPEACSIVAIASAGRAQANPARTHNKWQSVLAATARCRVVSTPARDPRCLPLGRSSHACPL